ncbi:hypothetical protein [Anaeromassilibacillus sp. An250]|uniref:hypothetical protein n=1 Tax=Anaeromassilibacillus sp. An250 TaxID=1965604 RepID=UPI000B36BFAA|nr:hypothetical protein [Anaeromassilibacillus sp. An250]OUO73830.1 hypothetical protein B5F54_09295 [Anaeromassilibacillus sp. An250]
MIDIESIVFSTVASALREKYDGIFVSGEFTDLPAKFPAVTIVESDNSIVQRMRTTNIENAVTVMYEVGIYSNTVGYKKSEAKDILEVVDNEFAKMGFARILCNPVANLSDATIYRIVARYQASIDKDLWVYRAE